MAERSSPVPANWVPVTVRLRVPAGISGAEVRRLAECWDAKLNIKLDLERLPVPVRPPRAEREEFRRSESQLLVVRALVHPQDIPMLKAQPFVDHVERGARLEPFGPPEWAMTQRTAARYGARARVECAAAATASGTSSPSIGFRLGT